MRTLHLPIAEPCHEDWDAMDPRERGKFCQRCSKDVHDLSSMTEDEAHEFLREHRGTRVCVNYRYHDDGRIHFRSPTRAALATAALAAAALAACTPHERAQAEAALKPTIQSAGAVAIEPPPPAPPAPVLRHTLGEMVPEVAPPPVQMRKGDVAVPNEPCDAPPASAPKHAIRGDVPIDAR